MASKTIFAVLREQFYVKLETEFENSQAMSLEFSQMGIIEELGSITPTVTMLLRDNYGSWTTVSGLSNSQKYTFSYGADEPDGLSRSIDLKIGNFSSQNAEPAARADYDYHIDFIGYNTDKLIHGSKSRSWAESTPDEVVEKIVTDAGIEEVDLDEAELEPVIIQPDISDASMIGQLCQRAYSYESGDKLGLFVYGMTTEQKFLFKNLNKLFDKEPVKTLSMTYAKYQGFEGMVYLKVKNRYAGMVDRAGGIKSKHFDYRTGQFNTNELLIEDLDITRLGVSTPVHEQHHGADLTRYDGRNVDAVVPHSREMAVALCNMHSLEVIMVADFEMHVGELVTLVEPTHQGTTLQDSELWQNAGDWLVTRVNHQFVFDTGEATTTLKLVRVGHMTDIYEDLVL